MSFSSLPPPRLLKSETVALKGQGAQFIDGETEAWIFFCGIGV
jgi:hypothetical protein